MLKADLEALVKVQAEEIAALKEQRPIATRISEMEIDHVAPKQRAVDK